MVQKSERILDFPRLTLKKRGKYLRSKRRFIRNLYLLSNNRRTNSKILTKFMIRKSILIVKPRCHDTVRITGFSGIINYFYG